ncbi:MAG: O-antigen ligase family protein [Actinomycetota bacterium]|nr:O-antigen ligase family protein [Actinomycetota bacterium]
MRRLTFALVLLMTATLPLESAYSVPGSSSLSKLLGLLAAGSWLLTVIVTGRLREPHPIHLAALLFVLWNACSLLWSVDVGASEGRVLTYLQLLGLMLVLWDTVTTMAALTRVLLANLVGCYVAAGSLIVGYIAKGPSAVVHGRVSVGSFNPNDAGLILALGLPIAAYFVDNPPLAGRGRGSFRVAAASYLPLAGFAILGTGSRAAVAAAVASLCYAGVLLARRSRRHLLAGLAAVVAATAGAAPFLPAGALLRFLTTGRELQKGDLNERQQVWPEALRLIHEHPFVGVGSGAFRTAAVSVHKVGHNFVLALLAELGPLGLALFCSVLVLALRAARHSSPRLRAMWFAMFAAWMSAALLHNWEYRKLTWVLLGLMAASGSLRSEGDSPTQAAGTGEAVAAEEAAARLHVQRLGPRVDVGALPQLHDASPVEALLNRAVEPVRSRSR